MSALASICRKIIEAKQLPDHFVVPKADYESICDDIREMSLTKQRGGLATMVPDGIAFTSDPYPENVLVMGVPVKAAIR
jgi:hypothetical protein